MNAPQDLAGWKGRNAVGESGEKIGKIEEIYLDEQTGRPEWLAVTTGLFGSNVSFVPTADARPMDDDIRVPYTKDHVKDAPNVDADGALSQQEEERLYRHYGLTYGEQRSDSGLAEGHAAHGDADRDRDRELDRDRDRDHDDGSVTRSEEELRVGTERREKGRARLRKYVVTEEENVTVPVQREELRVEREPITGDEARRGSDHAIGDDEQEVVLHEERPVVQKETVAKERVRADVETRSDEVQVSEQVRKEQVDVDDATGGVDRDRDRR